MEGNICAESDFDIHCIYIDLVHQQHAHQLIVTCTCTYIHVYIICITCTVSPASHADDSWHPHCLHGRRECGRLSWPCSCLVAGGTNCCLFGAFVSSLSERVSPEQTSSPTGRPGVIELIRTSSMSNSAARVGRRASVLIGTVYPLVIVSKVDASAPVLRRFIVVGTGVFVVGAEGWCFAGRRPTGLQTSMRWP